MADDSPITIRVCRKCGVSKPETLDYFKVYENDGKRALRRTCRACMGMGEGPNRLTRSKLSEDDKERRKKEVAKASYLRHREKRVAEMRARRAADPERTKEEDRRNYLKNKAGTDYNKRRYQRIDKDAAKAAVKKWKASNPDRVRAMWQRTYEKNKAKHLEKSKNWQRLKRSTDPEWRAKAYEKNRQWRHKNKDWVREDSRKKRIRRKADPVYQIMASVRARLHKALKGNTKSARTTELLGAPLDVVKAHIEHQFADGMTWANWGRGWGGQQQWHLDHIRPLASFDLTDPQQLALACHYTNLQPLWAIDNLKKGHGRRWQEAPP